MFKLVSCFQTMRLMLLFHVSACDEWGGPMVWGSPPQVVTGAGPGPRVPRVARLARLVTRLVTHRPSLAVGPQQAASGHGAVRGAGARDEGSIARGFRSCHCHDDTRARTT